MTFQITKSENEISLSFSSDYFYSNCNDATIDFDELEIDPTFTIHFIDDKPFINDDSIYDESHLEQLFNCDVLTALIAADSRLDNSQNPY